MLMCHCQAVVEDKSVSFCARQTWGAQPDCSNKLASIQRQQHDAWAVQRACIPDAGDATQLSPVCGLLPVTPGPIQPARAAAAGKLGLLASPSSPVSPPFPPARLHNSETAGRQPSRVGCVFSGAEPRRALPERRQALPQLCGPNSSQFLPVAVLPGPTFRSHQAGARGIASQVAWTRRRCCSASSAGPSRSHVKPCLKSVRGRGDGPGELHAGRHVQCSACWLRNHTAAALKMFVRCTAGGTGNSRHLSCLRILLLLRLPMTRAPSPIARRGGTGRLQNALEGQCRQGKSGAGGSSRCGHRETHGGGRSGDHGSSGVAVTGVPTCQAGHASNEAWRPERPHTCSATPSSELDPARLTMPQVSTTGRFQ